MSETFNESFELMVIVWVFHNLFVECLQLLFIWKFSINNKESSLKERRFFCELFDWITSILKDTFFSIDERNSGDAVHSVHVSWIEWSSDSTGFALNFGEISGVDGTISDSKLIGLSCSVVCNSKCVLNDSLGCGSWAKLVSEGLKSIHGLKIFLNYNLWEFQCL